MQEPQHVDQTSGTMMNARATSSVYKLEARSPLTLGTISMRPHKIPNAFPRHKNMATHGICEQLGHPWMHSIHRAS